MKVDWKYFSQSKGYKSLKEAYMRDCRKAGNEKNPMRNKAEFYKHFQWVIARCLHYASKQNRQPWDVLDEWESGRSYWWLNYYQDCNQPKIRPVSTSKQPIGARGANKRHKQCRFSTNNSANREVTRVLRGRRTKKAKWTIERKSRRKRLGD